MRPEFLRKAELTLIGLALLALVLQLLHLPFASILLVLSISALAVIHFQFSGHWYGRPTQQDQEGWLTKVSGLAIGVVLVGVLFAIQQWPNSAIFLFLGSLGSLAMAVVTSARQRTRPELAEYHRKLLLRLTIAGSLGAVFLFLPQLMEEPLDLADPASTELVPKAQVRTDWGQLLADSGATGVFVLWEPNSGRLQVSDSVRASTGYLPASTFKVFNSLVALQEKAVSDEHSVLPWDGIQRNLPGWNEDQHMAQAIQRSTVWWYQEVARRAGEARMQHWLDSAGYGNAVMGDSIHLFWLQGGLRITPIEQVRFLQRLNEENLPFDLRSQRIVKRILPGDSTSTWKIQGKTGWAIRVQEQYGWYVGWVKRSDRVAYFALLIDIHDMAGVRKRVALTYSLLEREGWIDTAP